MYTIHYIQYPRSVPIYSIQIVYVVLCGYFLHICVRYLYTIQYMYMYIYPKLHATLAGFQKFALRSTFIASIVRAVVQMSHQG